MNHYTFEECRSESKPLDVEFKLIRLLATKQGMFDTTKRNLHNRDEPFKRDKYGAGGTFG